MRMALSSMSVYPRKYRAGSMLLLQNIQRGVVDSPSSASGIIEHDSQLFAQQMACLKNLKVPHEIQNTSWRISFLVAGLIIRAVRRLTLSLIPCRAYNPLARLGHFVTDDRYIYLYIYRKLFFESDLRKRCSQVYVS